MCRAGVKMALRSEIKERGSVVDLEPWVLHALGASDSLFRIDRQHSAD